MKEPLRDTTRKYTFSRAPGIPDEGQYQKILDLSQDAKQDNVYKDYSVNKNAVDSGSVLNDILLKHRSSSSINC